MILMGEVNGILSAAHTRNLLMHPIPLMQTFWENVFPICTFKIKLLNKQRCVETEISILLVCLGNQNYKFI